MHEDRNDSLSALQPINAHEREVNKLPFFPNFSENGIVFVST
jgi:hypothetical protein